MSAIIDRILEREGSVYTEHAADKGGPTRHGITQKTLSEHLGRTVTPDEVRNLSVGLARDIYSFRYILEPGFDKIPNPILQELLIDCGVNHGPRHAVKWLQQAVGTKQDGVLGWMTLRALEAANARDVYLKVLAHRVRLYGRLVSGDPMLKIATKDGYNLQAVFAAGWNNRAAEFIELAANW